MAPVVLKVGRQVLARPSAMAVIGGLVVAAVAGAFGATWLCLAAVLVSLAGEPFLHRGNPTVIKALRTLSLGLTVRIALRLLAATAALAHRPHLPQDVVVLVLAAFLLLLGRAVYVVAAGRLGARRRSVMETRNVPLQDLDVPPPPPEWVGGWSGSVVFLLEALVTVPACLPLAPGSALTWIALVGGAGVLGAAAWCEVGARRTDRAVPATALVAAVQRHLDAHAPEVVLYFGDNAAAVYQADMWLSTLERLPQRCLVVLRSRAAFEALGPTRLPVLCIPAAVDMMTVDFSSVRVALYVANIGNNIHMLRVPGIRSSFIGHGDSDKKASFNPYSRVYSQVWVAGPAGRRRYQEADVGVADRDVVEVGRPQLDAVPVGERRPGAVPTILYAPTWEGWDEDQAYSSVATHGIALARAATREGSGVRLVYRPHPFTGRRDPAVAAAHREIVRTIERANQRDGHTQVPPFELSVEDQLASVRDPLLRSLASGRLPAPLSAVQAEQGAAAVEARYWAALEPGMHLAMQPGGPSLTSTFAAADLLVTDVSSVLSDYVSTGRPYAVCNSSELPEPEFLAAVPSAVGGPVLARGADVELVLSLVRGELTDRWADVRRGLRVDLLGPEEPSAQSRFERAVRELSSAASMSPARAEILGSATTAEPVRVSDAVEA